MRKFVFAVVVTLSLCGVAFTDEFGGLISKVDGDKITFTKFDFATKDKGEPKTLPVSKDCKVFTAKFNKDEMKMEKGEPIDKGLKNEMFTTIGEKGLFATITTDKDNKTITQLSVFQFGKKKKG